MSEALLSPGQFYGTPNRVNEHNGILLSECDYFPNTKLPRHSHESPFFCLLLKGNYQECYYRKVMSYSPCSIVFHPAGESHHTDMGNAGGSVFLIEVGASWSQMLSDFSRDARTKFGAAGTPLSWLAQQIHREMMDGHPSPLLTETLLVEMLGRTIDCAEERFAPAWLRQVMELIHDRYTSSFTVTQIAAEVGVHPFHLSRVFRFFNGIPVGDYVNRLRIGRAKQILGKPGRHELCQLAIQLGFSDQSHFTRIFRKFTGFSPARFARERLSGL
jgi:AraC-like DNA-binding protein